MIRRSQQAWVSMMTAKLCTTVADVPQDRTLLKRDAHCYKSHFCVQNHSTLEFQRQKQPKLHLYILSAKIQIQNYLTIKTVLVTVCIRVISNVCNNSPPPFMGVVCLSLSVLASHMAPFVGYYHFPQIELYNSYEQSLFMTTVQQYQIFL